MLEDAKTALGVVEPLARFGSSAFGPLRLRVLSAAGVSGDWLPLGTLVRLPGFKELRCPHNPARPCTLTGTNLFLAASIAATQEFDNAADAAAGVYRNPGERSASGERRALSEAARRSGDGADAHPAGNAYDFGRWTAGRAAFPLGPKPARGAPSQDAGSARQCGALRAESFHRRGNALAASGNCRVLKGHDFTGCGKTQWKPGFVSGHDFTGCGKTQWKPGFVSGHDFTGCGKTQWKPGFVSGHDFSRAASR